MSEYENLPDQKELEREIGEYLSRKYGRRVKIVTSGFIPMPTPEQDQGKEEEQQAPAHDFHFDTTPEELISFLDQYVIRQDEAKAILATKICTHFNRICQERNVSGKGRRNLGRIKNNVLLVGPTGVGKTYLIKLIADHLGVPFVKGDATKFSETGYVGGDVEDLVRDLVRQADGDIDRAQYGIIYVDEIDKIAASEHRIGADVSRTGVQRALLKPMEETEVELKVPHDPISQIEAIEHYRATGKREKKTINTRNILFIMSGAFAGLDEIIRKRTGRRSMGFERDLARVGEDRSLFKEVKAEDLIAYGFESEFVGRLPVVAVLDPLTVDDLYEILVNPNSSVILAKKQDFKAYGIHILFEDEALREIARLAAEERTGARGLVSVVEKTLLHFEKKLPSTDIRHLVVTAEMVGDPGGELARLLMDPGFQEQQRRRYEELKQVEFQRLQDFFLSKMGGYLEAHGVLPTPSRLMLMAKAAQSEDLDPREICDQFIELAATIWEQAAEVGAACGIKIRFDEDAVDRLLAREPRSQETVRSSVDSVLKVMEYGLRLLSQKKGIDEVVITAEGVNAPEQFINRLVSRAFKVD